MAKNLFDAINSDIEQATSNVEEIPHALGQSGRLLAGFEFIPKDILKEAKKFI